MAREDSEDTNMSAAYSLRIKILRRTVGGKLPNGEDETIWPDPPAGVGSYSARRLNLNAGEEIRQGVRESSTFLKLELRGRSIPVEAVDRVKLVTSGQIYRLTGPPIRERRHTVINLESV